MRSLSLSAVPRVVTMSALSALVLASCRNAAPSRTAPPPAAEFVLAAGDSTFWVTSAGGTVHVRGAPLELAHVGGRFYEIYVADDDRSFQDAMLVGQRIYRRDLISGDSMLVYEDTIVPRVARQYARLHPDDSPIRPDDDGNDDPLWRATTSIDVADLHGPFLSYTLHADVERDDAPLWHTSHRGVLDLTTGHEASLAQVAANAEAEVIRLRTHIAAATLDSVRAAGDDERERTSSVLQSYHLDPSSFILTTVDGQPAVAYALRGQGTGDAGHLLALQPISIGEPAWWRDVASTLPIGSADGTRDVWRHGRYEVVARYDPAGSDARLVLRDSTSREWVIGRVPAPALRVFWLDQPPVDSIARVALARAFDESALYDETVRSASLRMRTSRATTRLVRATRPRGRHARVTSPRHRA